MKMFPLKSSVKPPPANKPPLSFKLPLPSPCYYSLMNDRLYFKINQNLMWTDHLFTNWKLLEVRICFWSSAAWPPTSCICDFPLCILSSLWRTDTIIFVKLNEPPSQISPPSLLSSPPNVFEINKPPREGGLINRGFTIYILSPRVDRMFVHHRMLV